MCNPDHTPEQQRKAEYIRTHGEFPPVVSGGEVVFTGKEWGEHIRIESEIARHNFDAKIESGD